MGRDWKKDGERTLERCGSGGQRVGHNFIIVVGGGGRIFMRTVSVVESLNALRSLGNCAIVLETMVESHRL